jgi:hypothetical protein
MNPSDFEINRALDGLSSDPRMARSDLEGVIDSWEAGLGKVLIALADRQELAKQNPNLINDLLGRSWSIKEVSDDVDQAIITLSTTVLSNPKHRGTHLLMAVMGQKWSRVEAMLKADPTLKDGLLLSAVRNTSSKEAIEEVIPIP